MTTIEMNSVMDVALELGKRKQSIFKVIKRLGIEIDKRRDTARGNQFVAYITPADYQRIKEEPFKALQDGALFRSVKAEKHGYAVVWNDEIDLSESEIWIHGLHRIG